MNRDDFSIFQNPSLVYFDSAATTQKPSAVLDAVRDFYENDNANTGRGIYDLAFRAEAHEIAARKAVANFLGAKNPEEIVFTTSATESLNLLAKSYGEAFLRENDEILLSYAEHHSNILPWQTAAKNKKAKLIFADYDENSILEKIGKQTKIVSLSLLSNVLGSSIKTAEIIKKAHENGAIVILDAAQAVAHMNINLEKLGGPDFLVFSGHKIYAENGVGVLYGKHELLEKMPPFLTGGGIVESVTETEAIYKSAPEKFEAGSHNTGAIVSLKAALDYFIPKKSEIFAHEKNLTEKTLKMLKTLPFIELYGENQTGIIAFNFKNLHPHDVTDALNQNGIAIRAGHHCAEPLMHRLKIASCCRISFGLYNTEDEIEILKSALIEIHENADKLYRKTILKHSNSGKNRRKLENATKIYHAKNASCGDDLTIYLLVDEKTAKIKDASFSGTGCAISQASASMFCDLVRGKTLKEAGALTKNFRKLIRTGTASPETLAQLGDAEILKIVSKNPTRAKCATLAWTIF